MGRKLFVGNLPFQTGETELQELFARIGQVETVQIMRDMATGRARGFAFVEMATEEDANRAATELNQSQFGGRTIAVNGSPSPAGAWWRLRAAARRRRWTGAGSGRRRWSSAP